MESMLVKDGIPLGKGKWTLKC